MSIMYCDKHGTWDSDKMSECPRCDYVDEASPREIGWIEAELEAFAVGHRRHKASNQDAFREKLHAEAVEFLAHQGLLPMPFQVLSRGGRR